MKVSIQVLKILIICLIFTQGILAQDAKKCSDTSQYILQNRNKNSQWREITTVEAAKKWLSCFEPHICASYPGNKCNDYKNKIISLEKTDDKKKDQCSAKSQYILQNRNKNSLWKDITTLQAAKRWLSCFETHVCASYPGNKCKDYKNKIISLEQTDNKKGKTEVKRSAKTEVKSRAKTEVKSRAKPIEIKKKKTEVKTKKKTEEKRKGKTEEKTKKKTEEKRKGKTEEKKKKKTEEKSKGKTEEKKKKTEEKEEGKTEVPSKGGLIGWRPNGKVGTGWCQGEKAADDWTLINTCPKHNKVRVLTYNLFWWKLFGERKGNDKSAGKLIARANSQSPFDFMGFQECNDIGRVLKDSSLQQYGSDAGNHAVAIAWNKDVWEKLFVGKKDITEDTKKEHYGTRNVVYGRFKNKKTSQTAFFMNFHGPTPVNSGGLCGPEAIAYNMLQIIGQKAYKEDLLILVGDFNQPRSNPVITTLKKKMTHAISGTDFGGVDHIFSNCNAVSTLNLGKGGSDHDALSATF